MGNDLSQATTAAADKYSGPTMLKPIREELGFSREIYESLDDEMIDVSVDRIEDTRRQAMPFDQFKILCLGQKDKETTHEQKSGTEATATSQ